ncbi:MAG: MBL fold metallo-hydrolase [Flavobacteriia bacterium]|nr:MBL fold metallo-hydrolase [Flavobacteriia bacterium]
MIHIQKFTFNSIQENTYIVYSNELDAIIVDPGCYFKQEENQLEEFVLQNKLKIHAIINTHAHIDHVLGNQFCCSCFNVPLYLHSYDLELLKAVDSYAHLYGMEMYKTSPLPDYDLNGVKDLNFGTLYIKVIFGPGHSPGHVALYFSNENIVISGDILFKGSFGRVDLPGGDLDTLKNTIYTHFFSLPDQTKIYSGHGEETTIEVEKKNNYILQF